MSDQSIETIERSLEADRLALAQSLSALRDKLSPSGLIAEGKAALGAQAAPVLAQLDGMVRRQPVVAAVAGVALAALVCGRRNLPPDAEVATAVPALAGTRFEALTRWEDEGGPPAPEPVDPEEDWLTEAQGLREKARHLLAQIDDAMRRGLAPAAQLAKDRADVLAALARDTQTALGKGLGSLTGAAREQALQARERIYLGRIALAEKGRGTVVEYPLAAGVLAAAAGASVASLFPPTEAEDRILGDLRDELAAEARAAMRAEAVKASDLARTLAAALKSDLRRVGALARPDLSRSPSALHH